MNKRLLIIVTVVVIGMLIGLNVYTIINSKIMSKNMNESSSNVQSIITISKLRTEINKLAQSQKLYLLTSNNEYELKYQEQLKEVYQSLDNMENLGYIDENEKNELIDVVNEYDKLAKSMKSLDPGEAISTNTENDIIKSNNAQLNILQHLDTSVEQTNQSLTEKSNTIASSSEFQSILIQIISALITAGSSGIAYYIEKSKSKFENIIKDEDGEDNVDEENKREYYKKCMEDIMKYETMLESARLIYMESQNMKDKLKDGNEGIYKIELSLEKLKKRIEEIDACSSDVSDYLIENVDDEITNLKILFQALPIYNDIVFKLSEDMKNKGYIKEL